MPLDKLTYLGLTIIIGCSTNNEGRIAGHWHCIKAGQCDFQTIDINDSVITTDKYLVGGYKKELYLDKNKSQYDEDVEVRLSKGRLILNSSGHVTQYIASDLQKCLLDDRYFNCKLDLSLQEVDSAKPFSLSVTNFTTGDIMIGKLRRGLNDSNDKLAKQYPDSIFIQVNDVLISYNDIPEYVRYLNDCMDCPKANINLHVDNEVPEGVVGIVVTLINPGESHSTIIYNVVKIRNGDIGLIRR